MPDIIQNIFNRVKEWWGHFSTKQKMLLISVLAVILVALGILAAVMSKPNMVSLITATDATQASSVKTLLEDNNITYKQSSDGMTFSVAAKDEADASILLGSNQIPTQGYSIDNVFDGSFSTTESDKNKKYQLYLEQKFAEQLKTITNVKSASVSLSIPENDGTIISKDKDTYASVILDLSEKMDEDQAAGVAKFIATEVGNDDPSSILIMDSDGNVLYSGGDDSTGAGSASSQLSVKEKAESMVKKEVKDVVLGTNVYDNVEVGINLAMNFDTEESTNHRYYVEDGQKQGYLDSESTYESTSTNGGGGVPGTTSNSGTTYVTQNSETSSSTVNETNKDYLPNEEITKKNSPGGNVDLTNSSISVVATTYVVYDEDALTKDGTLKNTTFDQFVAKNSARVKTTVDADFTKLVASATGIAADKITIVAYNVPFFKYSTSSGRSLMDYLQIALAVLIFALLGFVVFRSTRRQAEAAIEPEISVETLLESTKEAEIASLEDIGYNEKSEIRILIEKFVDENPEAAASLLRNWLNEEWE